MQKLQGLYVIVDAACIGTNEMISKTQEVLSAGVSIIQYRDKKNQATKKSQIAQQLRNITHDYQSLLIINDDVELACSIDADGIHLGKDDMAIELARKSLGQHKIIGASCYASFENAKPAIEASADYIAFGSFYPSPTKPHAPRAKIELLKRAKQTFSTPVCAIGGITTTNASDIYKAGADMIAVISSVFNASSPSRAVQEYLTQIQPSQH